MSHTPPSLFVDRADLLRVLAVLPGDHLFPTPDAVVDAVIVACLQQRHGAWRCRYQATFDGRPVRYYELVASEGVRVVLLADFLQASQHLQAMWPQRQGSWSVGELLILLEQMP